MGGARARMGIVMKTPNQSPKQPLLNGRVGKMRLRPPPTADLPVMVNDVSTNLDLKRELPTSPRRSIFSIKRRGKVPNYRLPCVLS